MSDSTRNIPDGSPFHQPMMNGKASSSSYMKNTATKKYVGLIAADDGIGMKERHKNKEARILSLSTFKPTVWLLVLGMFCIVNFNNVNYFRFVNMVQRDLLEFDTNVSSASGKEAVRVMKSQSSFTGPERELNGKWSDVKLLIYMTTHLSQTHISFLPCWYDAIQRLEIFQYADLMLYTPNSFDPVPNEILQQLPFGNIIIKYYNNNGYQNGAIQAMVDPFLFENNTNQSDGAMSWFDEYDWVIRLNPDVLIRDDTWLMETMMDESIDAIFHDCYNRLLYPSLPYNGQPRQPQPNLPKFHTDFTAFRPRAIHRELLLSVPIETYNDVKNRSTSNAEMHLTKSLWNIYQSERFAYVKGGNNSKPGVCRLEGVDSPILHVHELAHFCPYYYNATKDGIY